MLPGAGSLQVPASACRATPSNGIPDILLGLLVASGIANVKILRCCVHQLRSLRSKELAIRGPVHILRMSKGKSFIGGGMMTLTGGENTMTRRCGGRQSTVQRSKSQHSLTPSPQSTCTLMIWIFPSIKLKLKRTANQHG